jgi:hypothetical protein
MHRRSTSQAITRALKFPAVHEDKDINGAQTYMRYLTSRFQKEAQASRKSWQQLSWEKKRLHW